MQKTFISSCLIRPKILTEDNEENEGFLGKKLFETGCLAQVVGCAPRAIQKETSLPWFSSV